MAKDNSLWIDDKYLSGAALTAHLNALAVEFNEDVAEGFYSGADFLDVDDCTEVMHDHRALEENFLDWGLKPYVLANRITKARNLPELTEIADALKMSDQFDYFKEVWNKRRDYLISYAEAIYGEILSMIDRAYSIKYLEGKVTQEIEKYANLLGPEDVKCLVEAVGYQAGILAKEQLRQKIEGCRTLWYLSNKIPEFIQERLAWLSAKQTKDILSYYEDKALELYRARNGPKIAEPA